MSSGQINYTCSCGKTYKTENWFNKHQTKCTSVETEQLPEVVAPGNSNNKPYLKSNNELNSKFYYTVKSKANAGDDYYSPQQAALDDKKNVDDVVMVKETELKQGKKGKSYGIMCMSQLDLCYKSNHHLYELLSEERKLYLDIEYPNMNDEVENKKVMIKVINLLIKGLRKIGITEVNAYDFLFTKTTGEGEQGTFKNVSKMSYHIVLDNGYYFKSIMDIKKFMYYIYELAADNEEYKCLFPSTGFVIDMNVYTKNRLFKLPYQSKVGSPRVHTPLKKKHNNLNVSKWLCGMYINDAKYYNVSNIEVKGLCENKKVVGNDGRTYTGEAWKLDTLKEYLTLLPKGKVINKKINSLDDLVMSIYNGPEITSYQIFTAVGMAIHRATQGSNDGLKLWCKWTNQYSNTPLSVLNNYYSKFDFNKGYGYSTLKMLASQCNPQVMNNDNTDKLFVIDTNIETKKINERFIGNNKEQVYNLDKYNTIYVKSPMGTGKSYELHKIFNSKCTRDFHVYPRIIYLSSRRAFASSMSDEFQKEGFKNYLDADFSGYENRVIISPESLFKLKIDTCDLLVIDESESIFKIISSPTLQNEHFITNTERLMKLITYSYKVVVMDAFLQQRTFDAVQDIRLDNNAILWINEHKPEERELKTYNNREEMLKTITKKLSEGKKCVFVAGNRELAKQYISTLDSKYKVQFYSRDNKLPTKCNVNALWSQCDLLVYTPTITCGISFTLEYFDELFMYISNVGSCIARDLIQASKRIRKFKNNNIHFCLTNNVIGLDRDLMPMDYKEIETNIIDVKRAIFNNSDNNANDWLIKCHIHNLVEEHISRLQCDKLFKRYFEQENIKGFDKAIKVKTNKLNCLSSSESTKIDLISNNEYNRLIKKLHSEGLTNEESNIVFKYRVNNCFKEDNINDIYNSYSQGLEYEIKQKRINLSNIILEHNYIDNIEDIENKVGVNEFEKTTKQQLKVIKDIKEKLCINNFTETINSNAFDNLKPLLTKQYIQELRVIFNTAINVDEVKKNQDIKTIINNILKVWNGFELKKDKKVNKKINGKVITTYNYKFACNANINCYEYFKPTFDLDL